MTLSRTVVLILAASAFAALTAVSFTGCAGTATYPRVLSTDLRSSTSVRGANPQLLLAGPARLLHVNVDGRAPVSIYRVAQRDGTVADCGQPATHAWSHGPGDRGANHVDLDVPSGEAVCLTVAPNGAPSHGRRALRVSWHAKKLITTEILTAQASAAAKNH